MVRSERAVTDGDPHELLFGAEDRLEAAPPAGAGSQPGPPESRSDRSRHRRQARQRRRRAVVLTSLAGVVVLVAAVAGFVLYQDRYHPEDFAGAGTGSVLVTVATGDRASDIAATLVRDKVVASARAFINAASANSDSVRISPGVYRLRRHMGAKDAVALLLDPSARMSRDVVVFEGATVLDVAAAAAKSLGVDASAMSAAIRNVSAFGLPSGYTGSAAPPTSVEGFLYPATYRFDPGTTPTDAVQQMISKFISEDRANQFASKARALGISPYQALIIASIAEKEAKVAADYPKVARVILNRIAANQPLQIDATSAYAAKLQHLDPTSVIYAKIDSPYNSYTHPGLPPTPISSPGAAALSAAVAPASGNWTYYVNGDAQGDLFFTNSAAAFEKAVQACHANHWGCG